MRTTENTATKENTETAATTEYTFTKGEEISVETVDGNKISISKFDTVFIKTDAEIGEVEYNKEMTDKELKEAIVEGVDKYKTEEEIITEEVRNAVFNKESEVTAKQEEMKRAEEEKAKKEAEEKAKAEEEARKKAEEEAAKGLKVGNYTLKYGRYTGTDYTEGTDSLVPYGTATYTLKADGTYTYSTTSGNSSSGTYKVISLSSMGSFYKGIYGIEFSNDGSLAVPSNNTLEALAGAGNQFTYQGN